MKYDTFIERLEREFWVDLNGKVLTAKCLFSPDEDLSLINPHYLTSLHAEIAQFYYPDVLDSMTVVTELGWVRCNRLGDDNCYSLKEPTQSQINSMFDLGYTDYNLSNCGMYMFFNELKKNNPYSMK